MEKKSGIDNSMIRSQIDFPFHDAPDTACIVCKNVLDRRKQITFVSHDADDGMWQFLCDEPHSVDDARMISLSEALEIDGSLAQIADLPSGCQTSRKACCNWR